MQKLYEKDSYLKSFEARVLGCEPSGDLYGITLDKTAFFPEAGGQYADKGTLSGEEVLDVKEIEGEIIHLMKKPLGIGETVLGEIDFETRFKRMQNHSGEHLLCGIIHNLYGLNNVGFHLNDQCATMDIDGILEPEQIEEAERLANRAIYENRKINILFPKADDLEGIEYRAKLELTENVRIIEIEGIDKCACCAPHVGATGEIGILKVVHFYKLKKNIMRLSVVCGSLALEDYKMLQSENAAIMSLLSAKRNETASETERVLSALNSAENEIKELSQRLAYYELEKQELGGAILGFIKDKTYPDLSFCANKILEENSEISRVFLFSEKDENEFIYMCLSRNQDVSEITQKLNTTFSGRGGGKGNYSQGKLTAKKEEIIDFFN